MFLFFSFQLDYKVDTPKLKQVFKLAGHVLDVELSVDKDGNSRGFAVVEYQHPVEAVQAISMLDHQMLYDRRMTVRMDKITKEKLPEGLSGIGRSIQNDFHFPKTKTRFLSFFLNLMFGFSSSWADLIFSLHLKQKKNREISFFLSPSLPLFLPLSFSLSLISHLYDL